MTNHPATPPPELVQQWLAEYRELILGEDVRFARLPKPPSLKEDALAALHGIDDQGPTPEQIKTIRRALESIKENND